MNVLITGTAKGIGKAIAVKFLKNGHHVYGLDIRPSSIESNLYSHYICDITDVTAYPDSVSKRAHWCRISLLQCQ